ncbi:MAG: transposase [Rhodobacteraceae bacterium]|nr:transposase [Paracoccaceae bacterium]
MDAHSFSSRVEVLSVTDSGRRRRWTVEEKIRIVEESFSRPRAVSATARRHEISRALLTRWRAEYRAGLLECCRGPAFSPVAVMANPASTTAVAAPAASAVETKIEIVLGNGRRVVAPVSIDPAALARLLPVLDRA